MDVNTHLAISPEWVGRSVTLAEGRAVARLLTARK